MKRILSAALAAATVTVGAQQAPPQPSGVDLVRASYTKYEHMIPTLPLLFGIFLRSHSIVS